MNLRARSVIVGAALFGCLLLAVRAGAELPPSKNAPKVGDKMPDFTLPDAQGKPIRLYDLLAVPEGNTSAKRTTPRLLVIFYRGYW